MVAHNYRSQGKGVLVCKPEVDLRTQQVYSRALNSIPVDVVLLPDHPLHFTALDGVHCILVDECQFLSEKNVEDLKHLAATRVPVICYGLKTDYRSYLFPGSKRLLELADSIEEIKNVCVECDRKAIMNAKFYVNDNGRRVVVRDGSSEPDFGAEEKYQPMCWQCWRNAKLE